MPLGSSSGLAAAIRHPPKLQNSLFFEPKEVTSQPEGALRLDKKTLPDFV